MSVFKRGEVWWYKFYFANRLIRESAKTSSKTLPKEAEKNRRRDLEKGYNGLATEDRTWRVLTLSEAAETFLADYRPRHSSNSSSYMKYCISHLKQHIGDRMLIEIGVDVVLAYQNARLSEKASPKTINEEVAVLLQIMREMGDLIRVKMKRDKTLKLAHQEYEGKALMPEEIRALYDAARVVDATVGEKKNLGDTRSKMVLPAISLAVNATLRDSEAKTITWDRINFLKTF